MSSENQTPLDKAKAAAEAEATIAHIHSMMLNNIGNTFSEQSLLIPEESIEMLSYLNKNCTALEDFIISTEINYLDLHKLCQLNDIRLEISPAWYALVIELLIELNAAGWDRTVSSIKEKFAELRFYADDQYDEIVDKFTEKSKMVCETCGEKGIQRCSTSWDYVACRKHYLENRGYVQTTDEGFAMDGSLFLWKDVTDARFEGNEGINPFIRLYFSKRIDEGYELLIYNNSIGYGQLLKEIPRNFRGLDLAFLDKHRGAGPLPCMICGFIAVYNHFCECCENREWISKGENYWDREEYIRYHQSIWINDEGPEHAALCPVYLKDESYQVICTPSDLDNNLNENEA